LVYIKNAINGQPRAALEPVREPSGTTRQSKQNQAAFDRAVAEVTHAARHLLQELVSHAPPRDRAVEAAKAKVRREKRFGPQTVTSR